MRADGQVVLRTSFLKTAAAAVVAWAFVGFIVVLFTVTPASDWNPLADGFVGIVRFCFLLLFVVGLAMFGFGAVCWTIVYPIIRPRTVVSPRGVEITWWKPGGRVTQFATSWQDIVRIGGTFHSTKWPLSDMLTVTILAEGPSVHSNALMRRRRTRAKAAQLWPVSRLRRGRPRDVLAFLMQMKEAHGDVG
jgi:hypothetical protein